MRSELSLKIIELDKDNPQGEKVEKFLENLLVKDPTNIDLLLRLAILESLPPFIDYGRSFIYLDRIFKIYPNHLIALLCSAYFNSRGFGSVPQEVFNKLKEIHIDDVELNAMIQYALSWYYEGIRDFENTERVLTKSIEFCDGHVWNYVELARLYIKKNKINEACACIQKALKNVVKVYTMDTLYAEYDPTDVETYINTYIKGIYITDSQLNIIKKELS